MIEREEIISELMARLGTVTGLVLATRNWRKHATIDRFPAVFVIERPDEVVEDRGRPTPLYRRDWRISLITVLSGSTEEKAPSELAEFQKLVKEAIYKDQKRKIVNAALSEVHTSQVVFPKIGNNAVAQEIVLKVNYIEDVSRLFS